ncbi:hypothetical protein DITRI_Ditri06bG0071400 [Diplodiscus trichospermus]
MYSCAPHFVSLKFSELFSPNKIVSSICSSKVDFKVFSAASNVNEASNYIPAAPILLPDGVWKQIPGGVTAAKGFKAAGLYSGLRAKGEKPDLALVTCDVDANVAGAFTTNVVAAAPVVYCKNVLNSTKTARAVLINAGQANAATGDAGYQDVIECVNALASILQTRPEEVLIESTGVIGQRIKKEALLSSLPRLLNSLSPSVEGADSAAVAITTTDLVSKSVAIEYEVGGTSIRVGGMAKGSGMIHPNMATMLGVITTDALVESDVWRKMVQVAVSRSFNQITVDGDTSTNDTVIAFARISFDPNSLQILLGDIMLMDGGQPLKFDRVAASNYLIKAGETHGTVEIKIAVGNGPGYGKAWGCDLSYDYVKINAEYTT